MSAGRHASTFSIPVKGRRVEPVLRARFGERLGRLRCIKTDVGGHDLAVLRSLEGLIREFRPYLKSEVGKFAPAEDRVAMHRLLAGHRYTVRRLENGALFGPVLAEGDMVNDKEFDIFAVPT